mmetsp:Transcript_41788/g.118294  ORF Transcript_41788/g.118294 Transcript_41788/m.118294 type:complete len:306 (-) Transcript_41788:84-1001(-)
MASHKNDRLLARTVEGSVNHYHGQRVACTAADRGLAERLGGHAYNILSNTDQHEIYFRDQRPVEHFVDQKGRHTVHFFGARRRKYPGDERDLMSSSLRHPGDPPGQSGRAERRVATQLAQMENSQSYSGFQRRCHEFFGPAPPKKFNVHNARYANEAEKLRPRITTKDQWQQRRGEVMTHSHSAPSVSILDPAASLTRALREDPRKEASQRQLESANVAPRNVGNLLATSMDSTALGRSISEGQRHCSVNRVENADFAVSRKNNHFSSHDKLTRADPFYMAPRIGITNNSVKYDIISNERRWFKY